MNSETGVRGSLVVEKYRDGQLVETTERIFNAMVGQVHIIKRIIGHVTSQNMDGTTKMRVASTTDVELLAPRVVDAGFPTWVDGDPFATWRWVIPAGMATGAWDDVYISLSNTLSVISQFLGQNGTLGDKAAGDEWVIRYTLTVT